MGKSKTQEEIILKFKEVHLDRFDYSNVVYINRDANVEIRCIKHNTIFHQGPRLHLKSKHCCPICEHESRTNINTEIFIEKSNIIHNFRYDYSKVKYINLTTPVIIICKIHGEFTQWPNNHMNIKQNCNKCIIEDRRMKYSDFIERSNIVHNNIYDYSMITLENFDSKTKVTIICQKHGIFKQLPTEHCNTERGCTFCKESKGECAIFKYLADRNIEYIREYKNEMCKNVRCLLFDFYLPSENILIEYDGKQHYEPIEAYGGIKRFKQQKINDSIKTKFAEDNNIKLIRIPFTELENISSILDKELIS